MPWIYLLIAGIFEIAWTLGLKYSAGFSRPGPTIATIAAMIGTYIFLALAVKTIPLGTAYAIWTAIGVIGAAIFGIVLFNEPATATRIICILLILAGAVGLKLSTP